MENFFNLNSLVVGDEYRSYRKAIWLYVWLLVFEGALRKWILPELSTPLLLVRDPIAIWLTWSGLQRGWIKTGYVKWMLLVSSLSLFFSILIGHHNLFVGLYGWRIYFFHFPMMFVMSKVLTRDDFLKICRFFLIISIPMTILVVAQFYLPQTHWVNRGIGGDLTGIGFRGALGYFRPPGTFSFTSGYVLFQGIVCSCLFFYLMKRNELEEEYKFNNWLFLIIVGCFVVSIPTSISRTLVFIVVASFSFFILATIISRSQKSSILYSILLVVIVIGAISYLGIASEATNAMNARFEEASTSEGGVVEGAIIARYFGSFERAFNSNFPITGYGIGLGTNVGAQIMGTGVSYGFNGEEEWSRILGECGFLGFIIIGVRVLFSFGVLKDSFRVLKGTGEMAPWLFSAGVLLAIPNGQWAQPTELGMAMMSGVLGLTALKIGQDNYLQYIENDED